MLPGMMPILHSSGVRTPGQLGPISRDLEPLHADHVEHRDPFRDAHDQRHLRVDRLQDGIGREGRRHVDDAGVGAGCLDRFLHRIEDGKADMGLAAFAGGDAADHLGAVGDRLLGMESALGAGDALGDHAGGCVDENGHQIPPSAWATRTLPLRP
jgi:hypothetical protein